MAAPSNTSDIDEEKVTEQSQQSQQEKYGGTFILCQ